MSLFGSKILVVNSTSLIISALVTHVTNAGSVIMKYSGKVRFYGEAINLKRMAQSFQSVNYEIESSVDTTLGNLTFCRLNFTELCRDIPFEY